jgi:hypothetical protein
VYRKGFLSLEHQKIHVFLYLLAVPSTLTQVSQIWLFQNEKGWHELECLSPSSLFFDKKWERVGHVVIRELRRDVRGLFSVNF